MTYMYNYAIYIIRVCDLFSEKGGAVMSSKKTMRIVLWSFLMTLCVGLVACKKQDREPEGMKSSEIASSPVKTSEVASKQESMEEVASALTQKEKESMALREARREKADKYHSEVNGEEACIEYVDEGLLEDVVNKLRLLGYTVVNTMER